jgi:hypothetical protein
MFLRSKLTLVAAAAVSATLALTTAGTTLASSAQGAGADRAGATYVVLKTGSTTLALNPATAQVLADNSVAVAPASEARATSAGTAFPIQGGLLHARTLAGRVTHSGGLTFTAGGKDLTVRDFTINTRRGLLTAYVDEANTRLPILTLSLAKAKVTATAKHLTVRNVKATLTDAAATALNGYFGVSLFQGGLKIGTATVSASTKTLRG